MANNSSRGNKLGKKMDPIAVLLDVEQYYKKQMDQESYGPASTIQKRSGSALQAQIGTLGQQRDASSTTGNGASSKPRGACWDCGKEGHHKGDPSCPEPKPKTTTGTSTKSTGKIVAKHGLDFATAQATNKLIHAEFGELPEGTTPADELRSLLEAPS